MKYSLSPWGIPWALPSGFPWAQAVPKECTIYLQDMPIIFQSYFKDIYAQKTMDIYQDMTNICQIYAQYLPSVIHYL